MKGERFLAEVERHVLLGDGAMGTLLHERGQPWHAAVEALNLSDPAGVAAVHGEYVQAGAEIILTNTFGANANRLAGVGLADRVREINRRGAQLASEVAGDAVLVGGSVGPLGRRGAGEDRETDPPAAFREQIEGLLEGGVDVLVLETFESLEELRTAAAVATELCDLPLVCSMAYGDRGHTLTGVDALAALHALAALGADVVGGNCGSGPQGLLRVMERLVGAARVPLWAFPNASIPSYVSGRKLFVADADYIADCAERLADMGVAVLGGCCGTTPEHIAAIAARIGRRRRVRVQAVVAPAPEPTVAVPPTRPPSALLDRFEEERRIIVEVDPPRGLDVRKTLTGAGLVHEAGADAVSIADNPLASVRMSSLVLGHLVQSELGAHAVVHLTGRDHNLIGQQSLLLGASALGISSVLAVTGDPVAADGAGAASSVFDLSSFGLIELMTKLNQGVNMAGLPVGGVADFTIGVAFNPNAANLDAAVSRLRKKLGLGAHFVMTQPVYTPEGVQTVADVMSEVGVPVFAGVMPLVSARQAQFLHHEVPGIRIPDGIRETMREADEERAADIGRALARDLLHVVLDTPLGVYIITPFARFELAADLVRYVRERAPTRP